MHNDAEKYDVAVQEVAKFLSQKQKKPPNFGIILGTGLGASLVEKIIDPICINYSNIPHFPQTTSNLHPGNWISGHLADKSIVIMQGRFHAYEGYSMREITLPVRVMKKLGVNYLLISNAAGNLKPEWNKGDLMSIDDHLNLQASSPLCGGHINTWGGRFPDMLQPYDASLNTLLKETAQEANICLRHGVYACVTGPELETRAEYRMLKLIGADAVGMSTVPEVIVANQIQLPCCAVSVLTDNCDDKRLQPLCIADIIATASQSDVSLTHLFEGVIKKL